MIQSAGNKATFITILKNAVKERSDSKLTEAMINERVRQHTICTRFIDDAKGITPSLLKADIDAESKKIRQVLSSSEDNYDLKIKQHVGKLLTTIAAKSGQTKSNALLSCIASTQGYNKSDPLKSKQWEMVKMMLEQPGIDPSICVNIYQKNALRTSLLSKKYEYFKYIIDYSKKEDCPYKDIAKKKFAAGFDGNPRMYSGEDNLMYYAATTGVSSLYDGLYEMNKDKAYNMNRALIFCGDTTTGYLAGKASLDCENMKIFKKILQDTRININYQYDSASYNVAKSTVLTKLVARKKSHFLEYLLNNSKFKSDIDINKHKYSFDSNLIFSCAVYVSLDVFDLLVKHFEWDLNKLCGYKKDTLLIKVAYQARSADNLELLEKLIKMKDKVDINIRNGEGMDVIDWLLAARKESYLDLLIEERNVDKKEIEKRKNIRDKARKFSQAAWRGDYDTLKNMLKEKDSSDYINIRADYKASFTTYYNSYVLHAIVSCAKTTLHTSKFSESTSNFKCFKLLLNDKRIIDYLNNKDGGNELLTDCILQQKAVFVKYLTENCDKIGLKFDNVNLAGSYGSGSDDDDDSKDNSGIRKDDTGDTPLMKALISTKNYEMVKYLLNCDAIDINRVTRRGCAMHIFGPNATTTYNYDETFALESKFGELFQLFVCNNKLNLNILNHRGDTVIGELIRYDRIDFLKYLLSQNGHYSWNINNLTQYRNDLNETLLHIAAQGGSSRCLKYLLSNDIDRNIFDYRDIINNIGGKNESTPLVQCISSMTKYSSAHMKYNNNYKCFRLLLNANCDPKIENKFGYNAWDMCYRTYKELYIQDLDNLN